MNKLKRTRTCEKYFRLTNSFLSNIYQSVLPNVQILKCLQTKTASPHVSFLESLLFLVYINNLPEGLT